MKQWLLMCLLLPMTAMAAIDTYEFANEEQRERYNHFSKVLRCPMCQNQNLDGSDSAVSEDLRRELHRLVVEGRDDDEIIDFMVTRYGEFILYDPPVNKDTVWLWLLPVLLFVAALLVLVRRVKSSPQVATVDESAKQRARAMLEEDEK
jgi:cytochrome c-type biogenesis protein CcmH